MYLFGLSFLSLPPWLFIVSLQQKNEPIFSASLQFHEPIFRYRLQFHEDISGYSLQIHDDILQSAISIPYTYKKTVQHETFTACSLYALHYCGKIFLWCFHNGRRLPSDVINSVSLKIPQEGGVTDGYTRSYCFAELMHCLH